MSPRRRRKARSGSRGGALALGFLFLFLGAAEASRLKDLVEVEGVRPNQLFGFGLVVGLAGTGDRQNTEFTVQTLTNLLQTYQIRVRPEQVRVKNVAAVMVVAELPAYAQPGTRLDATVSSIGDAQSLSGGTLLLTPLKGPDGRVYAVAQGPVSLGGGFIASGIGARVTKNHQTVGRVAGGVLVERRAAELFAPHESVTLQLRQPDFMTAHEVARAINGAIPGAAARALSPGTVVAAIPPEHRGDPVSFLARIEPLEVSPQGRARVVVNERTGTVIIGHEVRIRPVAVAHGGLHISVKTEARVSQPPPFSRGETVVVPDTTIVVEAPEKRQLVELPGGPGVKLGELVMALNTLGVTPLDLIAVFQALREAGALEAELSLM